MYLFFLVIIVTIACPVSRDKLVLCFSQLVDLNQDSIITATEIDFFLDHQQCIDSNIAHHISGQMVINTCDMNKDGILSIADWTRIDACIQTQHNIDYMCTICVSCGWKPFK